MERISVFLSLDSAICTYSGDQVPTSDAYVAAYVDVRSKSIFYIFKSS
jgi:hypothetical protein